MSISQAKPNVGLAGTIMMIGIGSSRLLGIFREMVISWRFGQNALTSAYTLSFQIPELVFYLAAGGALSSAFIPVFSEYLHTDREDEAWHVFSSVVSLMSLVLGGVIVLLWVFARPLAPLVAPGETPQNLDYIAQMSRIVLPAQFAFLIGALMIGTLYARQSFKIASLAPNLYNLGIIGGALLIAPIVTPQVAGMSWGALVGALVGNLVLPLWAMHRLGSRYRFQLDFRHPGVKKVFKLMAPVILGLSLPGVFPIILRFFGSMYQIAPLPSAIYLSNQFMQAPIGVFGQSMALAAFPALTQFFAQGRMDAYRVQVAASLRAVVYLSVAPAMLMIVVPEAIVGALMQHGRFHAANTEMTALCLRMFAIGIPAWCMHPTLMRSYFAIQQTFKPILLGTITSVLFVAMAAGVYFGGLGYWALPLTASVAAYLMVGLLLANLRGSVGPIDVGSVVRTVGLTSFAALVPSIALLFALRAFSSSPKSIQIPMIFLGMLACLWAYFWITVWMKLPETETVRRALSRKFSKKGPSQG